MAGATETGGKASGWGVGTLASVGTLARELDRAHAPMSRDIAAFLHFALRSPEAIAFASDGTVPHPAPALAELGDSDCARTGGSDMSRWVCRFTYRWTDGGTYRLALTALLRATVFRPDRIGIANVGMFHVTTWCERDQREMFAATRTPIP